MPYDARIDSTTHGFFGFLIDQSDSMSDPFGIYPDLTLADMAAASLNVFLGELTGRAMKKHYFDIAVIGYGAKVASAFTGALAGQDVVPNTELPAQGRLGPLTEIDSEGIPRETEKPQWIDPVTGNGTPMAEAIDRVAELAKDWARDHQECYPPVVLNITDAEANIGGDPAAPAERLKAVETSDGTALLFNCHISKHTGDPLFFPTSPTGLPDQAAINLFEMSSLLPESAVSRANSAGISAVTGSRGFVYHGDPSSIAKFLDVGTPLDKVR